MAPAEDFASSPPATAREENSASAAADSVISPSNKEDNRDFSKPDGVQSQPPPHSDSAGVGVSSTSPESNPDCSSNSQALSTSSSTSAGCPVPAAKNEDEKRPPAASPLSPSTPGSAGGIQHFSCAQPQQPAAAPLRPSSSFSSPTGELQQEQNSQPQKSQMKPPARIVYDLPAAPVGGSGSCNYPPPPNSTCDGNMGEKVDGSVGERCCLDAADSHIDLDISPDGLHAACLHTDGFQYTWKGVRTTYGVSGNTGQFYFEVKVVGSPAVVMPETPPSTQNVCRIGVSQPFSSLFLGESGESWGFGGTAKKSHARKFENYGQPYGLHDVIGVVIDLQNLKLSFLKNGSFLGTAYTLPPRVRDTGVFPHLYLKNVDVDVNFRAATAWFPPPNKQIKFIGDLPPHSLLPNGVEHPRHVGECEFIMMVGLPACGKTYWAERHCLQNPTKSYVLLGTNAVIDQMRVMGVRRQANYASRWEELMSTATAIFNGLVARAGTGLNPRNVIIDQTNVYRNARRRKVQPFLAWGIRRAVTIVNDEYTLQQRTQKREQEEGKFVPVAAVKEMEAAFCLPHFDDGFTVIDYPELPEMESRQQVRRYNEDGRKFKRENPNAMGNQTKPHMEKRRPEEFLSATELYPDKKRGRISNDDQQPQYRGGGVGGGGNGGGGGYGGGAGGGGWGGGTGGRRDDFYGGGVGGSGNGGVAGGGGNNGGVVGGGGDRGRGGGGGEQQQWRQQQMYGEGGRQVQRQQQNHMYPSERGQQQQWGWQQEQQQQQQEKVRTVGYYHGQGREADHGNASSQYAYQSSHQRDYYYASSSGAVYGGDVHFDAYAAGAVNRGPGGRGEEEGYQTIHAAAHGDYYSGNGRSRGGRYQQPAHGEGSAPAGGGRGRVYYAESSSYHAVRPCETIAGAATAAGSRGEYSSSSRGAGGPGDSWNSTAGYAYPRGGGGMHQQQQTWESGRYRGGGGGGAAAAQGGPGRRF